MRISNLVNDIIFSTLLVFVLSLLIAIGYFVERSVVKEEFKDYAESVN